MKASPYIVPDRKSHKYIYLIISTNDHNLLFIRHLYSLQKIFLKTRVIRFLLKHVVHV